MRIKLPKVIKVCKECNEEYEVHHSERNRRIYCSRTCASRNFNRKRKLSRVVTKNCEYCGEEFTRTVYNTRPEPRYCCTDCANRHRVVLKNGKLKKDMV